MHQLVVLVRERDWENQKWFDYFKVTLTSDPEQCFRHAIKEYLLTEDGRKEIKQTCEDFNWGDAIMYVPEEIWNKHGIYSVENGETLQFKHPNEILVEQDEVLIPTEYSKEEE